MHPLVLGVKRLYVITNVKPDIFCIDYAFISLPFYSKSILNPRLSPMGHNPTSRQRNSVVRNVFRTVKQRERLAPTVTVILTDNYEGILNRKLERWFYLKIFTIIGRNR